MPVRLKLRYPLMCLCLTAAVYAFKDSGTAPETPTTAAVASQTAVMETAQAESKLHERVSLDQLYVSQPRELTTEVQIKSGDTLLELLSRADVGRQESHNVIQAVRGLLDPRALSVGKKLEISTREDGDGNVLVTSIAFRKGFDKRITVTRTDKGTFAASEQLLPVRRELFYASGVIDGSLSETASKLGIPASKMVELVAAYSYDIDFQRQIKLGDRFEVIIERFYDEQGEFNHYGNIVYSALTLGSDKHNLYYFETAERTGYFDESGNSVKKELLRTPINAARITSKFGMRRHPVLGYSKMHRGVDFAAPIGTPIYAAGDGTVSFAGRKNGYGNYLKINHSGNMATAYAHLSRFGSNIRPGSRVKQGQVVAYVGNTGMSTGPHLHFEVMVNNDQVNPLSVKFASSGQKLTGKDLEQFNARKASVNTYLASVVAKGQLASR